MTAPSERLFLLFFSSCKMSGTHLVSYLLCFVNLSFYFVEFVKGGMKRKGWSLTLSLICEFGPPF